MQANFLTKYDIINKKEGRILKTVELDKKTISALNSDDDYAAIESSSWLTGEIADGKAKEEMLSYFSKVVKREHPELSLSLAWKKYKEENNV